jgi:signal transduction histidine kinase
MGFSEILQESSDLQDDSRDLFERISANSQILHQIVEQILTLTESDMRRLGHEESVNIRSVVENELNHLRALIATKGLQVNLEFSGETDTALLADRQHISQMIGNVLNNAVKFTSKGSVTINVSVAPAVLTNAVNVVITIRDTGLGMAKADWERCFDVFTQVKSEYNRSYGGTGIGLTIARKYARAMGGDVSIQESALGLGTVVRISLTLQRAS